VLVRFGTTGAGQTFDGATIGDAIHDDSERRGERAEPSGGIGGDLVLAIARRLA
jgi:hypothetical protein